MMMMMMMMKKRLQAPCFCLILLELITGCLSVSWDMKVSLVVTVPRGEDAVLSCSFTHPRQQDYSGTITVEWRSRESTAPPFFRCSVKNGSVEEPNDCSPPETKYSLKGDPRRGELSLLIREVHMGDNGTFFCRVELDGWRNHVLKQTQLYVTVKPRILSLSVVETSSAPHGAARRLQCEVEGHPSPAVTWLSASGGPVEDQVQIHAVDLDRLRSSVPYPEEEVLTCRAESRLGVAEWRYPPGQTLMVSLTVGGLVVLLLTVTGFFCRRSRARPPAPVCGNNDSARSDAPPVYENAETMKDRRQRAAEDDVELLVYSDVSINTQSESLKSSGRRRQQEEEEEETGVVYSPVNLQQ